MFIFTFLTFLYLFTPLSLYENIRRIGIKNIRCWNPKVFLRFQWFLYKKCVIGLCKWEGSSPLLQSNLFLFFWLAVNTFLLILPLYSGHSIADTSLHFISHARLKNFSIVDTRIEKFRIFSIYKFVDLFIKSLCPLYFYLLVFDKK